MLKHWSPWVANWPPKFDGILFLQGLGPILSPKVQHLLVTLGKLKENFSTSALTPKCKALGGVISTFAPIGMLDLG